MVISVMPVPSTSRAWGRQPYGGWQKKSSCMKCLHPRMPTWVHTTYGRNRRDTEKLLAPSPPVQAGMENILGFVKLLRLRLSSGERVPLSSPPCPLGGLLRTGHFGPTRESVPHLLTIVGR